MIEVLQEVSFRLRAIKNFCYYGCVPQPALNGVYRFTYKGYIVYTGYIYSIIAEGFLDISDGLPRNALNVQEFGSCNLIPEELIFDGSRFYNPSRYWSLFLSRYYSEGCLRPFLRA